jgi:hypothetical protein
MTPGARVGPYEILFPLGEGRNGLGPCACDTRLGHGMAIKVLPAHLAQVVVVVPAHFHGPRWARPAHEAGGVNDAYHAGSRLTSCDTR